MDGVGLRRSQEIETDPPPRRSDRVAGSPYAPPRGGTQISRSHTITSLRVPALLLLLTCCEGGGDEPLCVASVSAFPPRDTVDSSLPSVTHRVYDGLSL